jgi:hypothetical protein
MYIVTREINDYNQDGEYFVAAYPSLPTFTELKELLPDSRDDVLGKLLRGGGRVEYEYTWYNLTEVKAGEGV